VTFQPAKDAAPRRARAATASNNKQPRAAKPLRELRREIDGFIVFLNTVIGSFAPRDALDSIELAALVHAIEEEAKVNARFRRGLESLLNVTSGGSLWLVITVIVSRRVARHAPMMGPLGPIIDDGGAFVLSTINAEPSEAAAAMGDIMDMFKRPLGQDDTTQTPRDTAAGNGSV